METLLQRMLTVAKTIVLEFPLATDVTFVAHYPKKYANKDLARYLKDPNLAFS